MDTFPSSEGAEESVKKLEQPFGPDSFGRALEQSVPKYGLPDPLDVEEKHVAQDVSPAPTLKRVKLPQFLWHTLYADGLALSTILSALNVAVQHLAFYPNHRAVQEVVDSLIAQGLTQATIDTYNRYFGTQTVPLRLALNRDDRESILNATPDVSPANVAVALWKLLTSHEPTRLRRCPECQTYFFDRTRNRKKQYCSPRCTSRATSRDYRRAGKERAKRAAHRVTTNRKNSLRP